MATQSKSRSFSLSALVIIPMFLSGCLYGEQKQFFSHEGDGSGSGGTGGTGGTGGVTPTPTVAATATPTASGTPHSLHTEMANQQFLVATSQVKKIDFLFVVDNSGSMADNQAALAAGFEQFANTFYRRADLDICTAIITTDRYLGRSSGGYQRERLVACTKPAGSENWSASQMQSHIDAVIADFKNKVNVGINGSGTELAGKSLVTFLYNQNSWNASMNTSTNPAVHTSFFRADAVANISIVTDENNWFFNNSNMAEASNDLPPVTDAEVYNSATHAVDGRKGIKNHLDSFFSIIRPTQGLSYSVTTLLELQEPSTTVPGIAMNINALVEQVGRESSRGDIEGNAASFAAVYNAIGDSLVTRAHAFNLTHNIYEPLFPSLQDLKVNLIQHNGNVITLSYGSDFDVVMPNGVVLNQSIANTTQSGDQLSVDYRYEVH